MRIAVLLIAAFLASATAGARTPEEVVRAYFDRMKHSDEKAVARLIHPDALREFRATHEPLIQSALRSAGNRVGFSGFVDPYDPKKVRAFTDEDFMSTFIRWGEQWQPRSVSYLKEADIRVIGHVAEGELSHVVVHITMGEETTTLDERFVATTKDFKGEPLLVLPRDIESWAAALKPPRGR